MVTAEEGERTSARSGRCLPTIWRGFSETLGHTISPQQRKALRDIGDCRTAALGGHIEQCDGCPHEAIAYNSCRNRSCPKCQSTARDRWLAERAKELLPVPYCHVVFT